MLQTQERQNYSSHDIVQVHILLSHAREVWHLLLHFTLALKHLHLLDEHLLAPEQLHLTKP
jgi:hypothetical protein